VSPGPSNSSFVAQSDSKQYPFCCLVSLVTRNRTKRPTWTQNPFSTVVGSVSTSYEDSREGEREFKLVWWFGNVRFLSVVHLAVFVSKGDWITQGV
jgi:hypothetical protein